jgi:hypothetical protein
VQLTPPSQSPSHVTNVTPFTHPDVVAEHLRNRFGLMTQEQLSVLLNVTTDTLKVWRVEGHGPDFTRLGRRIFYRSTDVEKWIDRQVCVPGSAGAAGE